VKSECPKCQHDWTYHIQRYDWTRDVQPCYHGKIDGYVCTAHYMDASDGCWCEEIPPWTPESGTAGSIKTKKICRVAVCFNAVKDHQEICDECWWGKVK
jgi:hypothetical protein